MFLFTIVIIAIVTAVAIFAMYLMLSNFTPGESRVREDVAKMKDEIQPWIDELIPWKKSELELLSVNNINKQVKKGIIKTAKGVLTSIYQEPLVAYSFKQYFGKKKNAVLYAQTSNNAYEFRIRENRVEVSVDGRPLGLIKPDGRFYDMQTKQLSASINRTGDDMVLPIVIRDKEMARLQKPGSLPASPTTRAFEYVNDVSEGEKEVVLSLGLWEVLKKEVPLPVEVEAEENYVE